MFILFTVWIMYILVFVWWGWAKFDDWQFWQAYTLLIGTAGSFLLIFVLDLV